MPNPNRTAVVLVLDKSSSMSLVQGATISGFNEFIETQRQLPGEVWFTLTLFDSYVRPVLTNVPLSEVPLLNRDTYLPLGMTALYDAVGTTIDRVGRELDALPEEEKPGRVLFVIQTDGEENCSREYTSDRVKRLIAQQRDQWQWEFMFLGAEQDAWQAGATMGITASNTLSYGNANTADAFATISTVTTNYRSTGTSVSDTLTETGTDLRSNNA